MGRGGARPCGGFFLLFARQFLDGRIRLFHLYRPYLFYTPRHSLKVKLGFLIKKCLEEKNDHKIYPDEIFLDSKNISGFDTSQFEGRLEKPIGKKTFIYLGALVGFFGLFFVSRIFYLQVFEGEKFTARSERNSFKKENITPLRGAIYDSAGTALVWNGEEGRMYADIPGLGHILGYTGLPSKDDFKKKPDISSENVIGKDGVEAKYDEVLRGFPE